MKLTISEHQDFSLVYSWMSREHGHDPVVRKRGWQPQDHHVGTLGDGFQYHGGLEVIKTQEINQGANTKVLEDGIDDS